MRFPEIAYAFKLPTDVAGPTALILSKHLQISTGATTVEQFITGLAKDRVLVLTNVSIKADPGAGQSNLQIKIQGFSQGIENFNIDQRNFVAAADENHELNWQGEVYIQGGGPALNNVRLFSTYSSAVAANTMTVGVHGIIIPRGNLGGF